MYPGHGVHMRTNMTTDSVEYGTLVNYTCDPGFEMFGSNMRMCLFNGSWSGMEPICAINVARHRIVAKASQFIDTEDEEDSLDKIVDGFYSSCSVATNTDMVPSYWSIDLLQDYIVNHIKIAFGEPVKDILFDVLHGNATESKTPFPIYEENFANPNSVFGEFEYGAKEMTEYNLWLKYPVITRFVTVRIPTQYQRSRISLCEIAVYSATASSSEQCKQAWAYKTYTAVHDSTCYSVHHEQKLRWKDARLKCITLNNGSLVNSVTETSQEFLRQTLKNMFSPVSLTDVFWVGGNKRRQFEETTEKYFLWNKHDSGGAGDPAESCLSISGPYGWRWMLNNCYSHYPWICQYKMPSCGSPDQMPMTMMALTSQDSVAEYSCPEGHAVEGTATRTCLPTGQWSGTSPYCRYVNCGQPTPIANGSVVLVQGTMTYGSVAEYECDYPGLHLIGSQTRICQKEGTWSGDETFCSDVMPDPEGLTALLNLEIVLATALACLGLVVVVTVITLCIVFFKKSAPRKEVNGVETKTFLATFDSEGDLGPDDPATNGTLLNAYDTPSRTT